MEDKRLTLEFTPIIVGAPEYGTECVVIMNGSSYGTAMYDYTGKWVNENYDPFEQSDVTHWLPIISLDCLPNQIEA